MLLFQYSMYVYNQSTILLFTCTFCLPKATKSQIAGRKCTIKVNFIYFKKQLWNVFLQSILRLLSPKFIIKLWNFTWDGYSIHFLWLMFKDIMAHISNNKVDNAKTKCWAYTLPIHIAFAATWNLPLHMHESCTYMSIALIYFFFPTHCKRIGTRATKEIDGYKTVSTIK